MTENEELLAEANKAARLLRIGAEMADVEETTEHVYRSSAAIIERLADIVARRDAALLAARRENETRANALLELCAIAAHVCDNADSLNVADYSVSRHLIAALRQTLVKFNPLLDRAALAATPEGP